MGTQLFDRRGWRKNLISLGLEHSSWTYQKSYLKPNLDPDSRNQMLRKPRNGKRWSNCEIIRRPSFARKICLIIKSWQASHQKRSVLEHLELYRDQLPEANKIYFVIKRFSAQTLLDHPNWPIRSCEGSPLGLFQCRPQRLFRRCGRPGQGRLDETHHR